MTTILLDLIDGKGHRPYGLAHLNQRAHALQTAWLAEQAGSPAGLITAAFLHDIGHMVHDLGEDPAADGVDDHHETLGATYLTRFFGPEVTEPVRLHVAAKRFLCAAESDYLARLSADSVRSLTLQGGPMSVAEQAAFLVSPFAMDAVRLRRWDEATKVKGLTTPDTAHFAPYPRACAR